MAFPTGKTMSGTKSDIKSSTGSAPGSAYMYSTGTQPSGTPSVGNWNTGGSVVGVGDRNGVITSDGSRIGGQMTDPRLTGGPNVWTPQAIAQIGGRPGGLMPMPGGLTPGVAARPIPPVVNPVVAALARRLVTPSIPGAPVMSKYGPRKQIDAGQTMTENPAMAFSLTNFNNGAWGGGQSSYTNNPTYSKNWGAFAGGSGGPAMGGGLNMNASKYGGPR